jgi:tetratricopeptide (TPR) repeat protein
MTLMEAPIAANPPSQAESVTRSTTIPQVLAGIFGAAVVALPAAVHGGYFPTSWGWEALMLLAVAAIALSARTRIHLSRWEVAALIAVAGLLAWTVLSTLWASSAAWPIRESERTLVYVGGLLAMLLVVRRSCYRMLLSGVWVGIAAVSGYGLATRLFPGWQSTFDSFGGYRLSEPIGYWNGLGIIAAMGVLLALGIAARARATVMRMVAASSVPVLATAVYFTYSRGAWIALAIGLVTALGLDARRLQLVTSILLTGAFGGAAVALASRSAGLTQVQASRSNAVHDGRQLAVELLALGVAAGLSAVLLYYGERRISSDQQVRMIYAIALVLALVATITTVFVRYGDPATLARKGYHSLNATPPGGTDLNKRLFSISSAHRIDHWRVAWKEYRALPWLGSGAGTYEQYWRKDRHTEFNVRNAHNLYLETLATLGPVGLALLISLLVLPLLAAVRMRRSSLVPLACGAYVAFLLHAAIDWDWQLPAVTLAALACGAALLVAARGLTQPRALTMRIRVPLVAVTLLLFVAALVGLRGNLALAASNKAADQLNWNKSAREARTAMDWAPWSSDPWRQLAEAQYAQGQFPAARASFRKAITKDPENWLLWAELGVASEGQARHIAIGHAFRLNPLAPELADYRKEFGR